MNLKRLNLAFGAAAFSMSAQSQLGPGVHDLPEGLACEFGVTIKIVGQVQVQKEFVDRNGNVVRTLAAGKGSTLTFINRDTNSQLTTMSNGSVTQARNNPDGSQTVALTGHNVLILFDTDFPPGPSTTLYVGRVVYTVAPDGVFTLQQVNGKASDICAALS